MLDPHAVHEIFKYLFINILRRRHMPEYVRVDALNCCTQCTSRHLCDFCDVRIEQRLLDSTRHHFFFLSFAVDFSAVECLEILSSNENSALASDFVRVAMDAIVQRSAEIARFERRKERIFRANKWPPASMSLMACAASSSLKVMQLSIGHNENE